MSVFYSRLVCSLHQSVIVTQCIAL